MDAEPQRILVYDGDCPMCQRFSRVADWRWLVGPVTRRRHDAFEGEEARRLASAGIHNEMAVIDRTAGVIRSGYDGLVWLLHGGRLPWLATLLAFPPVRWLLRHDYRLVAYNRRILAPPRRGIACACDPDRHRGYRWAFIAAALLWTGLFAALGGLGFWTERSFGGEMPVRPVGAGGTLATGPLVVAGYVVLAPLALRLGTPRGLDYLGHLAWTYAAMVVPTIVAVGLALGALLVSASGLLPGEWALLEGLPAWTGLVAWGLAFPIAATSCLRRLPRLGFTRPGALSIALAAWGVPTALMATCLTVPFHGG